MKGRIIGREGRNIRAFEKATGVDVIIDDTPGVVIVSGFDTVRREVARHVAQQADRRRPHSSRRGSKRSWPKRRPRWKQHIQKLGEEAAQEADVAGLHPKIIHLLGRLRFRTSYSQNVLRHSIEVAFLTGMMAEEMGLDGRLARRCGLLHDIGKAADHEAEGGHPKIGAELLKRYGEGPEVVHAALGHHDDMRDRPSLHRAGGRGRRLQRLAPRRPARNARALHQADGRAGDDRHAASPASIRPLPSRPAASCA